ncbi:YopX family protein [Campylobacter coli]
MKLKDFDFRIWDKDEKCFLDPYTKSRAVVKNLPNEKLLNLEIELFTGLCDKNGNKIYEGDILYSFEDCSEDEAFKYKVVFKEEAFYLVECGDNGEEYDEDLISEFRLTELEIMGNIHENADLLKVEECKKNDIYIIKPLYSLGYTYNNNREDFKNYN